MQGGLDLKGIVAIVGNYGSGKTEVAINLAVDQFRKGVAVRVADLDLVNPYFRTREARNLFTRIGIDIVLPPEGWLKADLPILSPKVAGLIRNPGQLAILDVGGDGVGATPLAALADAFATATDIPVQMLQVINPFRPNTSTVQQCLAMRQKIESASRLTVAGWICNAHMMDETTIDHIHQGYALMKKLTDATGLPLICMTAPDGLIQEARLISMDCEVLEIRRQLVPPWRSPVPH